MPPSPEASFPSCHVEVGGWGAFSAGATVRMTLDLLAPSTGLALPSLAGVPALMAWGGDTATTLRVLVQELLRAGTFTPREGPVREDDPNAMISTGIARLVGVQPDTSSYGMTVRSVPGIGAAVLFTVFSAQFAEWGGVRAAFEAQDPRYARWFYRAVHRAVGRLGPLYDYSAAAWNVQSQLEFRQEDPPAGALDEPVAEGEVVDDEAIAEWRRECDGLAADAKALDATHLALLRRGRVPRPPKRGAVRNGWSVALQEVVAATRRLDRAGRAFNAAMMPLPEGVAEEHLVDAYESAAAAWPLTIVETAYDLVMTAFDEDAEHFYEVEHAPNVIIPLDTRSPHAMRRGFDALRALGGLMRALLAWLHAMDAFNRAASGAHAPASHAE